MLAPLACSRISELTHKFINSFHSFDMSLSKSSSTSSLSSSSSSYTYKTPKFWDKEKNLLINEYRFSRLDDRAKTIVLCLLTLDFDQKTQFVNSLTSLDKRLLTHLIQEHIITSPYSQFIAKHPNLNECLDTGKEKRHDINTLTHCMEFLFTNWELQNAPLVFYNRIKQVYTTQAEEDEAWWDRIEYFNQLNKNTEDGRTEQLSFHESDDEKNGCLPDVLPKPPTEHTNEEYEARVFREMDYETRGNDDKQLYNNGTRVAKIEFGGKFLDEETKQDRLYIWALGHQILKVYDKGSKWQPPKLVRS